MATALAGIAVRMASGIKVCVPATLGCITTYVLLEQEAWFEKEASFVARVLEPGDTAVDIGANYGVYGLALAAAAGPDGAVFAYEPAPATAAYLAQSQAVNGLSNLTLLGSAMSNVEGRASFYVSSIGNEFNALNMDAGHVLETEDVPVTTLDAEQRRLGWERLDFVKIDAEGEETRIIEGGRETLNRHSPLIMFEISDGKGTELGAAAGLMELGYGIYRLLGDGLMLVPCDLGSEARLELNLFAAKPDRAKRMEERGLLALESRPPRDLPPGAERWIFEQPYLAAFGIGAGAIAEPYRTGLAAYGLWRNEALTPAERYGAMMLSLKELRAAVSANASPSRLASLARVAAETDNWREASECMTQLVEAKALPSGEPFLPVSARFESLSPEGRQAEWFFISILEQLERLGAYSSIYRNSDMNLLTKISRSRLSSPEMARRLALQISCQGQSIPPGLEAVLAEEVHLNSEYMTAARLAQLSEGVRRRV